MLETLGFEPWMSGHVTADDARLGRVVRVDRGLVQVLTDDGPVRAGLGGDLLAAAARNPAESPATGDWVVVRDWPDERSTLESVLPRSSTLVRAVAGGQAAAQVVCANPDLVGVVVGLVPLPVISRVERLVALAWQSGARPIAILTKADEVEDAELVADDVRAACPDVEVVTTSVVTGAGLDRLRALVGGRLTIALLGASGHGKSSLANELIGVDLLATRQIRADGRGRHTSVRRELVPLPGGGAVVDTPGLRGIGMFDADEGVTRTFADLEELAGTCRFGDCAHGVEPGCAVCAALEDGSVTVARFERWQALRAEVATMALRRDVRAKRARSRGKKAVREQRAAREQQGW